MTKHHKYLDHKCAAELVIQKCQTERSAYNLTKFYEVCLSISCPKFFKWCLLFACLNIISTVDEFLRQSRFEFSADQNYRHLLPLAIS